MTMFGLLAVLLALVLAGLAAAVDCAARAAAWRHIAEERRWNYEHCRHDPTGTVDTP